MNRFTTLLPSSIWVLIFRQLPPFEHCSSLFNLLLVSRESHDIAAKYLYSDAFVRSQTFRRICSPQIVYQLVSSPQVHTFGYLRFVRHLDLTKLTCNSGLIKALLSHALNIKSLRVYNEVHIVFPLISSVRYEGLETLDLLKPPHQPSYLRSVASLSKLFGNAPNLKELWVQDMELGVLAAAFHQANVSNQFSIRKLKVCYMDKVPLKSDWIQNLGQALNELLEFEIYFHDDSFPSVDTLVEMLPPTSFPKLRSVTVGRHSPSLTGIYRTGPNIINRSMSTPVRSSCGSIVNSNPGYIIPGLVISLPNFVTCLHFPGVPLNRLCLHNLVMALYDATRQIQELTLLGSKELMVFPGSGISAVTPNGSTVESVYSPNSVKSSSVSIQPTTLTDILMACGDTLKYIHVDHIPLGNPLELSKALKGCTNLKFLHLSCCYNSLTDYLRIFDTDERPQPLHLESSQATGGIRMHTNDTKYDGQRHQSLIQLEIKLYDQLNRSSIADLITHYILSLPSLTCIKWYLDKCLVSKTFGHLVREVILVDESDVTEIVLNDQHIGSVIFLGGIQKIKRCSAVGKDQTFQRIKSCMMAA
ncbi:hypothetical protein BKA69DRAFT_1165569 [Paraphysoderma sedebokerense]|nr:hypothetical protein BKA69DRAFT_1165569 [Paraphysoderma sedebokerense]